LQLFASTVSDDDNNDIGGRHGLRHPPHKEVGYDNDHINHYNDIGDECTSDDCTKEEKAMQANEVRELEDYQAALISCNMTASAATATTRAATTATSVPTMKTTQAMSSKTP
jgi:hypothetical protein